MDIQFKKGLLEICVLAVLRDETSYGYKIIVDLQNIIEISESTLYPILKRLEAEECLLTTSKEHNGRLRKYYSITRKGRDRLQVGERDLIEIDNIYRKLFKGGRHD